MNVAGISIVLAGFALVANAQTSAGVRLLLGLGDNAVTKWDGSLEADGAHVDALEPWRFEGNDAINGTSWRCPLGNRVCSAPRLSPTGPSSQMGWSCSYPAYPRAHD